MQGGATEGFSTGVRWSPTYILAHDGGSVEDEYEGIKRSSR